MKHLIIDKDTKIGNAQIEAVEHFQKVLNIKLKEIFRRWTIVKNIKVEIPTDVVEEMRIILQYDTPNSDKSIKRAVSSFKRYQEMFS